MFLQTPKTGGAFVTRGRQVSPLSTALTCFLEVTWCCVQEWLPVDPSQRPQSQRRANDGRHTQSCCCHKNNVRKCQYKLIRLGTDTLHSKVNKKGELLHPEGLSEIQECGRKGRQAECSTSCFLTCFLKDWTRADFGTASSAAIQCDQHFGPAVNSQSGETMNMSDASKKVLKCDSWKENVTLDM